MQVKPRFETYRFIERHHILTDDTGNDIQLCLIECKLPTTEYNIILTPYRFWTVIGKNQVKWNNQAVSYESFAYWKGYDRKPIKTKINGIEIEEVVDGEHYIFRNGFVTKEGDSGVRTSFKIKNSTN